MKIFSAKLVSWDFFYVNNTNQTLKFSADMIWQVSQAGFLPFDPAPEIFDPR